MSFLVLGGAAQRAGHGRGRRDHRDQLSGLRRLHEPARRPDRDASSRDAARPLHRRDRRAGRLGQDHAGAPSRGGFRRSSSWIPACSIAPSRDRLIQAGLPLDDVAAAAAAAARGRRRRSDKPAAARRGGEPGRLQGRGDRRGAPGAAGLPAQLRRRPAAARCWSAATSAPWSGRTPTARSTSPPRSRNARGGAARSCRPAGVADYI